MTERGPYSTQSGTESEGTLSNEDRSAMINSAGSTEETDLLKTSLVVLKHKRMIAVTTILCMTLAVLYVLLLPNQYTGETKLLAPQTQDSMASVLSLQGALSMGGFGGAAKSLSSGMLGLKDPNAVYIGELKSHTIADRLIARFDLKTLYHKERQVDTRKALEGATKIESSKDGGITIQVTDKDRKRAADLANAYVQELQQLTDQLASYQASERSKYYESEIQKVQEQLISSEAALKGNQEKTGMLDAATQTKSVMLAAVSLKAEIAAKEVEIRGMSSFETPQNQDVKLAKEELSALQSQLAQLKYGSNAGGDDILVPAQKIPQDALEYLRNYRDVMYYERIYDLLSIQYAAAKADEGRNALVIQVLDPAEPPERKSKPHRTLIVFFVAILAFSGSVFAVFVIEGLEQLRRDPVRAQELDSIKAMLPGGFIRKWFFRPKAE